MLYRDQNKYILLRPSKSLSQSNAVIKDVWGDAVMKELSRPRIDLTPPIVNIRGESIARTDGSMITYSKVAST